MTLMTGVSRLVFELSPKRMHRLPDGGAHAWRSHAAFGAAGPVPSPVTASSARAPWHALSRCAAASSSLSRRFAPSTRTESLTRCLFVQSSSRILSSPCAALPPTPRCRQRLAVPPSQASFTEARRSAESAATQRESTGLNGGLGSTGTAHSSPPNEANRSSSEFMKAFGMDGASVRAAPLWRFLAAGVWPVSRSLRVRVAAALASLLAAKCLTIAAPVALAGLVDHFTVAAGEGMAEIAGGAAAAAGAAAAGGAAAAAGGAAAAAGATAYGALLLHPALPVGLVISYPLARLGASAFTELRTALFARVAQRASCELAAVAFSHMHSTSFTNINKIGELTSVLTRGTRAISMLLNVLLFQVVPTTLEFLMVLALLKLRVGWTVAATAIATISAYWAFTAVITTKRAKLRREMNRLESLSAGLLVDSLANAEAVRYFTAEAHEAHRFGAVQSQIEQQTAKVNESLAFLNFGQQFIFTSGLALALVHTANLVAAGLAPVGQIVLVSTLLMQLAIPLNFIGTAYRELTLNTIDLEKLQELLQLQPIVRDPPNPVVFQLRGGSVEFKDVTFAYPPSQPLDRMLLQRGQKSQQPSAESPTSLSAPASGKLVLNGFSLEVPAGRRVALVGESGSGKTTLIRLLYRLADPLRGVVSIDGQDLKTLPMMSFRRHIGVVPQDVALFNESLDFNLRYGSPHATDEQVKEAIRLAELTDLVESLPAGLDTPVGDRGLRLSGGEKQRVGIARCLLRNPEIVLFDEATSALDTHTEHKILKALRAVSHGRTTLVIAHRLSTVAGADTIAVLYGGRVAEIGTHGGLLRKPNGLYASMWNRQREGQTPEASGRY
ncbi:iron-sulfur clusters transporter ATM1, mitochondrial [Cyclospora cayetanensis]|uniref:Iron-sulfur clusters transporter ATM1, mitochondrial n=1 Tax=Cyclospora cayetanensis TaxID=88456 RepID=A0A6P6RUQ2_9EIME|nr:iron-sulfur clusters transporter ATM1, mitochondrial [Cyclospora cayetanensis]